MVCRVLSVMVLCGSMFHSGFRVPLGSGPFLINVLYATIFYLFIGTDFLSPNKMLILSGKIFVGELCLLDIGMCLARSVDSESSSKFDGVLYVRSRFSSKSVKSLLAVWSNIGHFNSFLSKKKDFIFLCLRFVLFGCLSMLLISLLFFDRSVLQTVLFFLWRLV